MSNILANLMFLRFYLLMRLVPNMSQWTDIHSENCCEMEGIEANYFFAVKSLLKEKPY